MIGMLYATIFEQQSFGTAMEFAVTALSAGMALTLVVWDVSTPFLKRHCVRCRTGGFQAPLLTDSDPAMVAVGLYVLLGIPIYTFTVGKIAGLFLWTGTYECLQPDILFVRE